jgi:hypothetical protein
VKVESAQIEKIFVDSVSSMVERVPTKQVPPDEGVCPVTQREHLRREHRATVWNDFLSVRGKSGPIANMSDLQSVANTVQMSFVDHAKIVDQGAQTVAVVGYDESPIVNQVEATRQALKMDSMTSILTFPSTILYGYANTFHLSVEYNQSLDRPSPDSSPVGSPPEPKGSFAQQGLFGGGVRSWKLATAPDGERLPYGDGKEDAQVAPNIGCW